MYIYFRKDYNPYDIMKAKYCETFESHNDTVHLCKIDGKFGLIREHEMATKKDYENYIEIEKTEKEIISLQEKLKILKNSSF